MNGVCRRYRLRRASSSGEVSAPCQALESKKSRMNCGNKERELPGKTFFSLNLHVVRLLGQGGFGKVFLVKSRDDLAKKVPSPEPQPSNCTKEKTTRVAGKAKFVRNVVSDCPLVRPHLPAADGFNYYAMKTMLKTNVARSAWLTKRVNAEQRVLSKLKHPFITECYLTLQTSKQLLFFSEYIQGGELFEFIQNFGPFNEDDSKFYLSEVLTTLEYLHSERIIYRDLKPENIMLCRDGHVKLIDFGLCRDNFPRGVGCQVFSATKCGSEGFIAPEVYRERFYGFAADWWSYGALAFFLMTGATPFIDQKYEGPVGYPKTMSKEAVSLISRLLDLNKKTRLGRLGGAKSVSSHRFFRDVVNWERVKTKRTHPPFVLQSDVHPGDHSCFPWIGDGRVCSGQANPKSFESEPDPFANFDHLIDNRLDEI